MAMMAAVLRRFILLGLFTRICVAHVRLTFPLARYPPLDFLDNVRTSPPCGVPKPPNDLGLRTTLKAGSTFNVTWSLAYPHQGGFRIEILDANDQIRNVLTPEQQSYVGTNDPTAQYYQVTLPKDECENCVIRLLRQAKEWSNNYQFWSCADVNIVKEPAEHCSEHGKFVNGQCQCDRLFSGDQCQYRDECWTDQDCGSRVNGKCQDLDVFNYPRRVCFCEPGWFGPGCQQISPLKSTIFDSSLYQYRTFGEDENKLFWRILQETNEIEMVLQYPSRSWIAIGWKPKNINPQCNNLNNLLSLLYGTQVGKVSQKPAVVATKPSSDNATTTPSYKVNETTVEFVHPPSIPWTPGVGVTGSVEETHGLNKTGPAINITKPLVTDTIAILDTAGGIPIRTQTSPRGKIDNNTKSSEEDDDDDNNLPSTLVTKSATFNIPITHAPIEIVPESGVTVGTGPYPSGGVKTADENESDVAGDLCYGEWRWPVGCRDCDYKLSWTYIEENDEIEFSIETKANTSAWTGVGFSKTEKFGESDFLLLKSVDGKLSVQDTYTTANNPIPQVDAQQNVHIPQVIGTHINGVLRAAFSRPRRTTDNDHDVQFTDTDCYYFVFPIVAGSVDAQGRLGQLGAQPKLSKQKVCVKTCNPTGVSAVVERSCDREFKFPPGCQLAACDYYASWSFNAANQMVNFNISSRELGRWTGIGFSKNGNMTGSDIIIGWVYENGTYITDRFAYGKQQPAIDQQQDIQNIQGRIVDDVQTLSFSRKLVTKDDKEDLSLKDCLYFLFPVGGGRVLARSTADLRDKATPVGFHDLYIPKVSKTPICICTDDDVPVSGANITVLTRIKRANDKATTPKDDDDDYDDEEDNATLSSPPPRLQNVTQPIRLIQPTTAIKLLTNANQQLNVTAPVPEPTAEPTGKPEPNAKSTPKAEPEPEPKSEPKPKVEPHAHAEPTAEGEPGQALHPMDCSDMIVGSAIGSLSRVEDYYTISRATPMVDEVYGGAQSLTAATGIEENGITTVIFRRKLLSPDFADHNITDTMMTVIWAKGQEMGRYNHSPNSGLETAEGKGRNFYGHDVLAYHGHKNRGVISLNFYEKPPKDVVVCRGEQVYPPGCVGSICTYNVTWMKIGDNVDFMMDVKMTTNRWTGIGFSKDGAMAKSDAVIVQVNPTGPVEVTDRYIPTYSKPLIDKVQNIFNVDAQYVNGRVKARFSRALATDDVQQDLNLTDCVFFLYPFEGGPVSSNEMLKHTETPARSEQICLSKCVKDQPKDKGLDVQEHPTTDEIRNYVIIAVACFLVIVTSIFAVCMLLRTRRRRSKDFKANRPLVPFSPYAYMMPSGTYPPTYQYPSPNVATMEKKPFDNQGYHPDYNTGKRNQQNRPEEKQETDSPQHSAAAGHSETTYTDWYNKVNAGQGQQPQGSTAGKKQRQGSIPMEPQQYYGPDPRLAYAQTAGEPYSVLPSPYVQYPNDPYGYYTLNGNSRMLPRGGYYAPY